VALPAATVVLLLRLGGQVMSGFEDKSAGEVEEFNRWYESLSFAERLDVDLCLPCPGGCGFSSLGCRCHEVAS
jgi:hypothetical protein